MLTAQDERATPVLEQTSSKSPLPVPSSTVSTGALAALLCALLLLPCLFFPLGKDASIFLIGGRTLAAGGTLYRDVWDVKPPLIYALASLPARLPVEHQVVGLYLLAVASAASLAFFGARLVAPVAGRSVAFAWVPIVALVLLVPATTSLGQCESWANAFGFAALWAWHSFSSKRSALLAGALLGLVPLLKATSLLPLLPFLVLARRERRDTLLLACGFALPLVGAWWWMRATGAQGAFQEIMALVVYARGASHALSTRLLWFFSIALHRALQVAPLTLLCLVGLINRTIWPARWKGALAASLVLGLAAMWAQNRNVIYQWTVLLPAFSLLAASGALSLAQALRVPRATRVVPLGLVLACLGATSDLWSAFVVAPRRESQFAALEKRNFVSEKPRDLADTSAWLRERARPTDRMWVWGFEPALYVYGPRPANRFIFTLPLCAPFAPPAWKSETWRALQATPPRFLVVQEHFRMDDFGCPPRDTVQLWRETPIYPWFARHYAKGTQQGDFAVYELRAPSG